MCEAKWFLKVLLIGVAVKGCHLITTNEIPNGTATILWNLSKYAVEHQGRVKSVNVEEGRQSGQYYPFPNNIYNRPRPEGYGYRPPYIGQGFNNREPNNLMQALNSIAANDELHCVPKLLCELTSGSRTETTELPFLPFNINMDSLVGLLSTINGYSDNPIILFGRAALLGLSARGNSAGCSYAYPRCPTEPDKLVNYLNNYNGGFFRYFNGAPQTPQHYQHHYQPNNQYQQHQYQHQHHQYQHQHPFIHQNHQLQHYGYQNNYYNTQQRILTKPTYPATSSNPYDDDDNNRLNSAIKFPADENYISNEIKESFYTYKSPKTLTFPKGETSVPSQYHSRDPKTLTFPAENIVNNVLEFQRPLPNHVALPMIFPTRTGTGELILDTDAFDNDYHNHKHYYNHIHFN